ncbi:hypothetical protein Hdeb2414_s0259g00850591 [Helianthus debilis subsp. tardiflorus]
MMKSNSTQGDLLAIYESIVMLENLLGLKLQKLYISTGAMKSSRKSSQTFPS